MLTRRLAIETTSSDCRNYRARISQTRAEGCSANRSTGKSTVAERITTEVKAGHCACEVKNPSGKCCLGDVTRAANDGLRVVGTKSF